MTRPAVELDHATRSGQRYSGILSSHRADAAVAVARLSGSPLAREFNSSHLRERVPSARLGALSPRFLLPLAASTRGKEIPARVRSDPIA